jgi:hypothetical protein
MKSILWSVNGIPRPIDVSKGITHNIAFFCDQVLPSLIAEIASDDHWKRLKRFMIKSGNAHLSQFEAISQGSLEATKAKRLQHPPAAQTLLRVTSSSLGISEKN